MTPERPSGAVISDRSAPNPAMKGGEAPTRPVSPPLVSPRPKTDSAPKPAGLGTPDKKPNHRLFTWKRTTGALAVLGLAALAVGPRAWHDLDQAYQHHELSGEENGVYKALNKNNISYVGGLVIDNDRLWVTLTSDKTPRAGQEACSVTFPVHENGRIDATLTVEGTKIAQDQQVITTAQDESNYFATHANDAGYRCQTVSLSQAEHHK